MACRVVLGFAHLCRHRFATKLLAKAFTLNLTTFAHLCHRCRGPALAGEGRGPAAGPERHADRPPDDVPLRGPVPERHLQHVARRSPLPCPPRATVGGIAEQAVGVGEAGGLCGGAPSKAPEGDDRRRVKVIGNCEPAKSGSPEVSYLVSAVFLELDLTYAILQK